MFKIVYVVDVCVKYVSSFLLYIACHTSSKLYMTQK